MVASSLVRKPLLLRKVGRAAKRGVNSRRPYDNTLRRMSMYLGLENQPAERMQRLPQRRTLFLPSKLFSKERGGSCNPHDYVKPPPG